MTRQTFDSTDGTESQNSEIKGYMAIRVTTAEELLVGSACEIAVTVTVLPVIGMVAGAV